MVILINHTFIKEYAACQYKIRWNNESLTTRFWYRASLKGRASRSGNKSCVKAFIMSHYIVTINDITANIAAFAGPSWSGAPEKVSFSYPVQGPLSLQRNLFSQCINVTPWINVTGPPFPGILTVLKSWKCDSCLRPRKRARAREREMVVMNQGSVTDYMWQHTTLYPWQPCREEPACSPKPPSVCGPARSIRYSPHLHSAPCWSAWSTPTPALLVRAIFTNSCHGTG